MSSVHQNLLASRSEFDAWILTGVEHFQTLSSRYADMKTVYGASPAANLLDTEYHRRLNALRTLHDSCAWLKNEHLSLLLTLPQEIIRHILTMATYGRDIRSWVKLGHICSELRHALLNIQTIWADSVCDVSRARDEIARRAGDAPLLLSVRTSGSYDLALARLSRARSLGTEKERFLGKLFRHLEAHPNDLSQLEDMILRAEDDFMLAWDKTQTLPAIFCPKLRSAVLTNIHVMLSSKSLAHLSIEDSLECEASYTPSELLSLLRGTPQLRTLKLKNVVPDFSDCDLDDKDVVQLLSLEKMNVTSRRIHCLLFWSHIVVPDTAEVAFVMHCREDDPTSYHGLPKFEDASFFKRHLRGVQHPIFTITSGLGPQRLIFTIRMPQRLRAPGHTTAKTILSLTYEVSFDSPGFDSADGTLPAIRSVRDALGLAEIEDLALGRNLVPFSSADNHTMRWHAILHLFPAVKYFTATGLPWALCAALRLPGSPPQDGAIPISHPLDPLHGITPALPHLQHMSLGFKLWHETRPLLAATDLAEMIQARAALGIPLRTLVLENIRLQPIYVLDSFVNKLRPLVPFLQTSPLTCESWRCSY